MTILSSNNPATAREAEFAKYKCRTSKEDPNLTFALPINAVSSGEAHANTTKGDWVHDMSQLGCNNATE